MIDAYMNVRTCTDIQRWLQAPSSASAPLPPAILAHVASCAACQAALLLVPLAGSDAIARPISCDACQEELPEFIEREVADRLAALREYPHIWQHIITCEECAEVYQLAHLLVTEEQSGRLRLPALPPLPYTFGGAMRNLLTIGRDYLLAALPPFDLLGATRADDEIVLIEELTPQGELISLSASALPGQQWRVRITLDPPVTGQIELHLGEARFPALLNADGSATTAGIPAAQLQATTGPELNIVLLPPAN